MIKKYGQYADYLLVAAIWVLIFGGNAFSSLMFVDYAPSMHFEYP